MNIFKSMWIILALCAAMLMSCGETQSQQQWTPEILSDTQVYLPDFSFAGYHWGEKSLPDHAATINIADFGAIPDDGQDDSDAILKAVAAAHEQPGMAVVKFPAGKFILSKMLYIDRSNFVLQGSGSGNNGTTIYLPIPMKDMPLAEGLAELNEYLVRYDKRVKSGELFSPFSWTGGIIWTRMPGKRIYPYLEENDQPTPIITHIENGKRGEHNFTAASTETLQSGDLVKLLWFNPLGETSSLLTHMYGEGDFRIGERHWENPERELIQQLVTITEIDGNTIRIKEPLLHDVRAEWNCAIAPAEVQTEIGIEHLRIEFPETEYGGHHLEHGYNAIYLTSTAHSWIRDVHFVNTDNAILSDDCANVTITDVTFSGRPTHYTTHVGKVNHFLVKNMTVDCPTEHSISFNTFSKGSVYTDVDILQTPSLDQHCGTNHQNLFDNIRISANENPLDLFMHGGAGYWKPTHGKFNTFWNIQLTFADNIAQDSVVIKPIKDGPFARFVGFSANRPVKLEYGPNTYFEGVNRTGIAVPSLYEFQLSKRLQSE